MKKSDGMHSKQYSIKVFELTIEDEQEFIDFIEKNSILFKNFLLYLKGNVTQRVEKYLTQKGLHYTKNLPFVKQENKGRFQKSSGLKIIDQVVRSGQEIIDMQDILILKRINSGAHIKTEGNFIALSKVEGDIECNGEFMLLKASPKASIFFHGVDVSEELDEDYFYKIKLDGNEIIISKYAKDIQWA